MNNEVTAQKTSIWHYIKVFCSFFSLIATFAAVLVLTEVRTHCEGYLLVMWLLGIVSAILVAPGKFFKFGFSIMGTCATFGWLLLPFPFDLVTVAISLVVGVVAVLAALFCVPAIFTIYTYVTDIRYDCVDGKKDLMAALAGVAAVLAAVGLFFAVQGITKAVEAPMMRNRFDPVECYQEYRLSNPASPMCPDEILADPTASETLEDGYVYRNCYEYTANEDTLTFDYMLQVEYEYSDGAWSVTNSDYTKTLTAFAPISGIWSGTGEYWGNLSPQNLYTLCLENVTETEGTGTLRIYLDGVIDEFKAFTVEVRNPQILTAGFGEEKITADLTLTLDTPLVYDVFGSKEMIPQVNCILCITDNTVTTTAFDFGEMILLPE